MLPTQINRFDPKYASFGPKHLKPQQPMSNFKPQALPDIGEAPPRVEPAPLATFQRPPSQNQDKYATIRTGGKYDKSHKYAQQMEREEAAAATLDRRQAQNKRQSAQKPPSDKAPNGVSIINQPLPEPPSSQHPVAQPLSAAHFTQYRSPAPPLAPCCPQGGQQSQHRSHSAAAQNRQGRTPEKFFSTSSQQQGGGRMQQAQQRPSYSHTLDRRHAHSSQQQQMMQQQQPRGGTQTLDRRSRQRGMPSQHQQQQQQQDGEGNKDMYAVTEL